LIEFVTEFTRQIATREFCLVRQVTVPNARDWQVADWSTHGLVNSPKRSMENVEYVYAIAL